LVISIPLGFFAGIGFASRNGILIKGSNYLEALNQVKVVVFDKTGTLTKGSFQVTKISIEDQGLTEDELLKMAATIEHFSNHPIAKSILTAYGQDVDQSLVTNLQEIPGHGLLADYQGKQITIGNSRLMLREKIEFKETNELGSILYIARDNRLLGYFVIQDELKPDAKVTIQALKKIGIKKTVMLTGDKWDVAEAIGKTLDIDDIHAELLPEGKLNALETYMSDLKTNVLYVGDGINDTPVLKRADIGVAMGGLGSDAAIEMSDIVILTDEPSKLITALKIAHVTRKIVWQNIIFAIGIKLLFLTLGAFGQTTMWQAIFADVGVSILAILNAFRIYKTKITKIRFSK
jgi:Cd2+/Zn2+-exporting ATPase